MSNVETIRIRRRANGFLYSKFYCQFDGLEFESKEIMCNENDAKRHGWDSEGDTVQSFPCTWRDLPYFFKQEISEVD